MKYNEMFTFPILIDEEGIFDLGSSEGRRGRVFGHF
jgi:hypothetical protein